MVLLSPYGGLRHEQKSLVAGKSKNNVGLTRCSKAPQLMDPASISAVLFSTARLPLLCGQAKATRGRLKIPRTSLFKR